MKFQCVRIIVMFGIILALQSNEQRTEARNVGKYSKKHQELQNRSGVEGETGKTTDQHAGNDEHVKEGNADPKSKDRLKREAVNPKTDVDPGAETKDVAEPPVAEVDQNKMIKGISGHKQNEAHHARRNKLPKNNRTPTTRKPKKKKVNKVWNRYCNNNLEIPKPWCWQV